MSHSRPGRCAPKIPWSQIVGMRNRLVHAYFQVDLAIVWEIVEGDLPPLKQQVEEMLGTLYQR